MQTVFIEVGANIFRRDLAGINGSETLMPLGKERLFWFFEKGEVTKKAVSGTLRTKISKDLLLDGRLFYLIQLSLIVHSKGFDIKIPISRLIFASILQGI